MKLRSVLVGLALLAAAGGQASADSLSPWGMWSDGAKLKKSKQWEGFSQPSMLGAAPKFAKPVSVAKGGARPSITPQAPATTAFSADYAPGSVVIDTAGRKLYYTLPNNQAYVYPIAVGKAGFTWTGTEKVSKIVDWPDWTPPAEMRQRKPSLPLTMTGGIRNPLGAKAIYLGNTLYRIHGTNDAGSIGTASSSGCIRMHNGHVVHLSGLVGANTTVYVLKKLPKSATKAPEPAQEPEAKGQDI